MPIKYVSVHVNVFDFVDTMFIVVQINLIWFDFDIIGLGSFIHVKRLLTSIVNLGLVSKSQPCQ